MAGLSSFRKREYYLWGINGVYVICHLNMINTTYLKNIPQYKYISVGIRYFLFANLKKKVKKL